MKPHEHAITSAKKYGGKPEDYIEIHSFLDSSKGAISDNRHRALTHTSWFLVNVLERVKFSNSSEPTGDNRFPTIQNSDGKKISVRDVGETHILEDFKMKFIPTVQDFLAKLPYDDWMQNGEGLPPSYDGIKISQFNSKNFEITTDQSWKNSIYKPIPKKPEQPNYTYDGSGVPSVQEYNRKLKEYEDYQKKDFTVFGYDGSGLTYNKNEEAKNPVIDGSRVRYKYNDLYSGIDGSPTYGDGSSLQESDLFKIVKPDGNGLYPNVGKFIGAITD